MRESAKSALGGIIAALSVSFMLMTYLSPFLVYTVPVIAGILLLVIVTEIGYRWAFGTYVAISLLSLFLIADKEAAVFFVMLFGYYPILRDFITGKIRFKIIIALIKLFVFNAALFLSIAVCNYVFHIDYSELTAGGKYFFVIFVLLMNAVLWLYDYLIKVLTELYKKKLQKKLRALFK